MAKRRIPGASPNPMTNLILTDILLRGVGRLTRRATEKQLLKLRYHERAAEKVVKGRSLKQTLVSTALARMATGSVPGALAVGGGMLAKTIYDRSKGRAAKRSGRRQVRDRMAQADD